MGEMLDPERERERLSVVMSCMIDDLAEFLSFDAIPEGVRLEAMDLFCWLESAYVPYEPTV